MNITDKIIRKILKEARIPFDFFIHTTDKSNVESILNKGLQKTKNLNIIQGIYVFPDKWYQRSMFSRTSIPLKVKVSPSAKYYDSDVDRPLEALTGRGDKKWQDMWVNAIKEADPKFKDLEPSYKNKDEKNLQLLDKAVNKVIMGSGRKKYIQALMKQLKGIDILQNGGEIIILNPKVITKVEKL